MDVDAPPRLIVDQAPAVPSTGRVLRQHHVARFDDLLCAGAGLELQATAQRDDILAVRGILPIEARSPRGLLQADGFRGLPAGGRVSPPELVPPDLPPRANALARVH